MAFSVRCIIWCFLLVTAIPAAEAATSAQITAARNTAVWWLLRLQDSEGGWQSVSSTEIVATSAVLDALANAGVKGYPYAKGVSWLANASAASTDTLARQIISLYAAGANTTSLVTRLIGMRNDASLSWGSYDHYAGSFPDTSLALNAIEITATPYAYANTGVAFITSAQNADGGWPYAGAVPAAPQSLVIPTAYNLLTLNRYKALVSVQPNIDAGIAWLKAQQKSGGGFGEGPSGTILETALAYQAIVADLGTADPAAVSAQDFLVAQNAAMSNDPFLVALFLQTLPPTIMADTDNDGVPDAVELISGTNPNVPDRYLAKGNGQSITGATAPTVLSNSILGQPFTFNGFAGNGPAPYTWSITAGSLPPGLSLNGTTGVISGIATAAGRYSFAYTVTDASGSSLTNVFQFDVSASAPDSHDGDLNGDGVVDEVDVFIAERIALGLIAPTASQLIHGDVAPLVNGVPSPDGVIDFNDVVMIERKALGLVNY